MTPSDLIARYRRRDDVLQVQISNRVRRDLGLSKKAMQREPDDAWLALNDDLPGACLVCLLDAPRDNVLVSAFDPDAEAFAERFGADPNWRMLGLS